MIKRLFLLFAALSLLIASAAYSADYVIGEGDVLEVSVWGVKELNFSVKVRPDGKITVPGLGDVSASTYTPEALQKGLTDKLKELVKNPIVTVTVKEITNSKVYIFGGGVKSGVFDLNRKTTLLQLLCTLGEVKSADLKKSYLMRNGKKVRENFHPLLIEGKMEDDTTLETSDSIFIPLLLDKNVYVLGAVNAPKSIEFREGITVMEAILEAGGFTKFADMNDVQIHRKNGNKEIEKVKIRARDLINKGILAENIKLKLGDFILVPESLF